MIRILSVVVFLVALIAPLDDASASDTSSQRFLDEKIEMNPSASSSQHNKEVIIVAKNSEAVAFEEDEFEEDFEPIETIADPYESYNRFVHEFNDKFYFGYRGC